MRGIIIIIYMFFCVSTQHHIILKIKRCPSLNLQSGPKIKSSLVIFKQTDKQVDAGGGSGVLCFHVYVYSCRAKSIFMGILLFQQCNMVVKAVSLCMYGAVTLS